MRTTETQTRGSALYGTQKAGRGAGTPSIELVYTPVRGTTYTYLDAICKKALSILARKNFLEIKYKALSVIT